MILIKCPLCSLITIYSIKMMTKKWDRKIVIQNLGPNQAIDNINKGEDQNQKDLTVHILEAKRKVRLQEIMMDIMPIRNMEDISKSLETLL